MYATVALTGKILRDGVPAVGKAILTPNVNTISDLDGNVVLYGPLVETLDNTGAFTINAPATDDPNLRPVNFGYTLKFDLESGSIPTIPEFSLPTATVSIDLTEIVPDPSNPYYVPTVKGPSAYEVAVSNGFVGTEAEWLATLSPDFTIGAVTTGPAGSAASVTITGTNDNPILNFIIPRGDQGNPGTGSVSSVNGDSGPNVIITLASLGGSPVGHTHDDRYYTESEIDTKLAVVGNKNDQLKVDTEQNLHIWQLEAQVIGSTQDMSNWQGDAFLTNQNEVATITDSLRTIRAASVSAGYLEQRAFKTYPAGILQSNLDQVSIDGETYTGSPWNNNINGFFYVPEVKTFYIIAQAPPSSTAWNIWSSKDGKTWTQRGGTPGAGSGVLSIVYDPVGGYLVAAGITSGGNGMVFRAPFIETGNLVWTQVHNYGINTFNAIIKGTNYWFTPTNQDDNGQFAYSTDRGATWAMGYVVGSNTTFSQLAYEAGIAEGAGVFVALGRTGAPIASCPVGSNPSVPANWTVRASKGGTHYGQCVYYGNGVFAAFSRFWTGSLYKSRLRHSTDGITWTTVDLTMFPDDGLSDMSVKFTDGKFYLQNPATKEVWFATDPRATANWTKMDMATTPYPVFTTSWYAWAIHSTSNETIGIAELTSYALPEVCNSIYILDSRDPTVASSSIISYEISLDGGTTWQAVTSTDTVVTLGHSGNSLKVRIKFDRTGDNTKSNKLYWVLVYAAPAV